jgi:hypothetical protein
MLLITGQRKLQEIANGCGSERELWQAAKTGRTTMVPPESGKSATRPPCPRQARTSRNVAAKGREGPQSAGSGKNESAGFRAGAAGTS